MNIEQGELLFEFIKLDEDDFNFDGYRSIRSKI